MKIIEKFCKADFSYARMFDKFFKYINNYVYM